MAKPVRILCAAIALLASHTITAPRLSDPLPQALVEIGTLRAVGE